MGASWNGGSQKILPQCLYLERLRSSGRCQGPTKALWWSEDHDTTSRASYLGCYRSLTFFISFRSLSWRRRHPFTPNQCQKRALQVRASLWFLEIDQQFWQPTRTLSNKRNAHLFGSWNYAPNPGSLNRGFTVVFLSGDIYVSGASGCNSRLIL